MARVLFLHGSGAVPSGRKADWLESQGHSVISRPVLPYPRHPRSWGWFLAYFDRRWFWRSVAVAQEAYDRTRPDVIVGVSMGGAVALNLQTGDTPQVLIAPAWRVWALLRVGRVRQVKPATIVLHGRRDRVIFPRYSRRLLTNSVPDPEAARLVASVEDRLAGRLARETERVYRIRGRLVVVEKEGHRCNGPDGLRALLAAVEVLETFA
jgi:predicted alpha/beta hydrolase family esterase